MDPNDDAGYKIHWVSLSSIVKTISITSFLSTPTEARSIWLDALPRNSAGKTDVFLTIYCYTDLQMSKSHSENTRHR